MFHCVNTCGTRCWLVAREAEALDVLFQDTAVHYDKEARAACAFGGDGMDYAFLHPDGASADADGRLYNFGDKFGAAENVNNVHGIGNVLQARITLFAEDFGLAGIYRNDAIAGGLQVLRDTVARPVMALRKADDSNGAAGLEDVIDGIPNNGCGGSSVVF